MNHTHEYTYWHAHKHFHVYTRTGVVNKDLTAGEKVFHDHGHSHVFAQTHDHGEGGKAPHSHKGRQHHPGDEAVEHHGKEER